MTKGQQWAARVRDTYECNEADNATVDVVADTMDAIEALPASAVTEKRMQRVVLLRALSQLGLPEAVTGATKPPLSASQRGRKAARARWSNVNGAEA